MNGMAGEYDDQTRRYFSPEHRERLLQLIVERMEIADDDALARKRWAERVRREWPSETYSGRLEVSLGQLGLKQRLAAAKCG